MLVSIPYATAVMLAVLAYTFRYLALAASITIPDLSKTPLAMIVESYSINSVLAGVPGADVVVTATRTVAAVPPLLHRLNVSTANVVNGTR